MAPLRIYSAPWCRGMVAVSAVATVLCLGLPAWILLHAPPADTVARLLALLPVLLVPLCLPFVIRSYVIAPGAIIVRRLFWDTCLTREGLTGSVPDAKAMSWSLRICGNGGLYSITGWYWNRRLGVFRAFVTDPRRSVVLRWGKRTVLVSPDSPEGFVRALGLGSGQV